MAERQGDDEPSDPVEHSGLAKPQEAPPGNRIEYCDHSKANQSQSDMPNWAEKTALAILVVYTGFAGLQWCTMRNQLDEGRQASREQAKETRKSLQVAKETAHVAILTLQASQPPNIAIDSVLVCDHLSGSCGEGPLRAGVHHRLQIKTVNVGAASAKDMRVDAAWMLVAEDGTTTLASHRFIESPWRLNVLPSGEARTKDMNMKETLKREEGKRIYAPHGMHFVVSLAVAYSDALNKRFPSRTTCWWHNGSGQLQAGDCPLPPEQ